MIIGTAAILVLVGGTAGLLYFGSPTDRSLKLEPHSKATIQAFRPIGHAARFSLYFHRDFGKHRPELGTDSSSGPGESIRLSVSVNDRHYVYEALPAKGDTMERWRRPLQPFIDDGDDAVFRERFDDQELPYLRGGVNTVTVAVLAVGPQLTGEVATVSLHPVISNVHTEPGYGVFRWFRVLTW